MCPTISAERWRSVGIWSSFYRIASDIVTMTYQKAPTPATVTVSLAQLSLCSNRTSHITFYIFGPELFYLFLLNFYWLRYKLSNFRRESQNARTWKVYAIVSVLHNSHVRCTKASLEAWWFGGGKLSVEWVTGPLGRG